MTAVLVSHPHVAAVSAGLAACLETRGQARGLLHGRRLRRATAGRGRVAAALAARRPIIRNRIVAGDSGAAGSTRSAGVELGARLAARLSGGIGAPLQPLRRALHGPRPGGLLALVGRARRPRSTPTRTARCGRSSARRARGLERIWDLPLPHYLTIEEILTDECDRWPGAAIGPPHREPDWKRRRKDARAGAGDEGLGRVGVHAEVAGAARPRASPIVVDALRVSGRGLRAAAAAARRAVHGALGRHPRPAQGDAVPARGLEARRDSRTPSCTWSGRCGWRSRSSIGYAGMFRALAARPEERARRALRGRRSAGVPDAGRRVRVGHPGGDVQRDARRSPRPAAAAPSASPTASTAGSSRRATSTRWSSGSGPAPPIATAFARVGRAARARAERWTWRDAGQALVPRSGAAEMRVLYLNPFSQEVSGPDESLRTLLGALIPRGVEAHVVLPAPGPQVPRYEALGARVHFAPLALLRRDLSRRRGALSRRGWRARRPRVAAHRPHGRRRADPHEHGGPARRGAGGRAAAACRTCCTTAATRSTGRSWSSTRWSPPGRAAPTPSTASPARRPRCSGGGATATRSRSSTTRSIWRRSRGARSTPRFARAARRRARAAAGRDRRADPPAQGSGDLRPRGRASWPRERPEARFVIVGAAEAEVEETYQRAARRAGRASSGLDGAADLRGRAARHPGGDARARCVRAHLASRRVRASGRRGDGGRAARRGDRRGRAAGAGRAAERTASARRRATPRRSRARSSSLLGDPRRRRGAGRPRGRGGAASSTPPPSPSGSGRATRRWSER